MRNFMTMFIIGSFVAASLIGCGGDKAAPAAEEPAKAAAPAPAAADGKASAADCTAACDNMKKILMASLPAETPAAVKAEAEKELAACPAECQKESTAKEAKCIAAAKSPEDMEKCAGGE